MASTTSRRETVRGRPCVLGAGNQGCSRRHWSGSDHWDRVDVAWETPVGYGWRSGGGTARETGESYSRPSFAGPMPLFPTPLYDGRVAVVPYGKRHQLR